MRSRASGRCRSQAPGRPVGAPGGRPQAAQRTGAGWPVGQRCPALRPTPAPAPCQRLRCWRATPSWWPTSAWERPAANNAPARRPIPSKAWRHPDRGRCRARRLGSGRHAAETTPVTSSEGTTSLSGSGRRPASLAPLAGLEPAPYGLEVDPQLSASSRGVPFLLLMSGIGSSRYGPDRCRVVPGGMTNGMTEPPRLGRGEQEPHDGMRGGRAEVAGVAPQLLTRVGQ